MDSHHDGSAEQVWDADTSKDPAAEGWIQKAFDWCTQLVYTTPGTNCSVPSTMDSRHDASAEQVWDADTSTVTRFTSNTFSAITEVFCFVKFLSADPQRWHVSCLIGQCLGCTSTSIIWWPYQLFWNASTTCYVFQNSYWLDRKRSWVDNLKMTLSEHIQSWIAGWMYQQQYRRECPCR